ncbi:MAG: hypothetical protein R3B48_19880 [Kofleriaceae bacterium]
MGQPAMKDVLAKIFARKRQYNHLPLFKFMRDKNIDAAKRLSFYPCMAHFILSFGDLNKYILRSEPAHDKWQKMVNVHTYEDDHHWPWYLEDLQKLGYDLPTRPSDLMRFLWGEETHKNRVLMYRLTSMIAEATSTERIAIIEAIEETGNVLFTTMLDLAATLEKRYNVQLRYCGTHHHALETGHAAASEHRLIASIELDAGSKARCLRWVDEVFDIFEDWTNELLAYAQRPALSVGDKSSAYAVELLS